MKKRIASLLLMGICFFGGFGVGISQVSAIACPQDGPAICNAPVMSPSQPIPTSVTTPATSTESSDDMTSTGFTLNPGFLSPSEKTYDKGTKGNLKDLLANIGKYLLIATTTIAVLSIVVGGLMISTTGTSDRAAKGKTIIMLNIMAVVVALFSYSIIRLVSWIIA